jgi:hypothetical protein
MKKIFHIPSNHTSALRIQVIPPNRTHLENVEIEKLTYTKSTLAARVNAVAKREAEETAPSACAKNHRDFFRSPVALVTFPCGHTLKHCPKQERRSHSFATTKAFSFASTARPLNSSARSGARLTRSTRMLRDGAHLGEFAFSSAKHHHLYASTKAKLG